MIGAESGADMGILAEIGINSLGDLSLSGILVLVLVGFLTGRLVSKTTLDRELAAAREAIELREASNQKLLEQQAKFVELTLLAYRSAPAVETENNHVASS